MMSKILSRLGLCCVLLPSPLLAQTEPQAAYQLPRAVHSVLTDIVAVGNKFWMAAGERGHILQSMDGQTWQQMPVPLQSNLNSIYFTDATHGWAVGHDATILHSADGGASWHIQQFLPELDKPLFDIYFKDPLHGITLKEIVEKLEAHYGFDTLGGLIAIKCFRENPSVKSSLTFLRKTEWARKKVEELYLRTEFERET